MLPRCRPPALVLALWRMRAGRLRWRLPVRGRARWRCVWLAPAGADASADLLGALGELVGDVQVLTGSRDLPGAHVIDVVATMGTLRTSCPWDRRQTHASLAPHLIEESYEALDALEQGDHQALREELGDVLLQVAFHAAIAAERGTGEDGYTIDDIADTLVAKLVRRHPHVFGDVSVGSADEVTRNWDEIKKAERAAKLAAAGADAWAVAGSEGRAGRAGTAQPRRPSLTASCSGSQRCRWRRRCCAAPGGPGTQARRLPGAVPGTARMVTVRRRRRG